jgi:glycine cleavage system T protein (aminomethyltransferase)
MAIRTSLFAEHVAAGAKMVDFAGFEMPLQYSGIVDEHRTVRSAVGLFDVSHMGEFALDGPRAGDVVRRLSANDTARLHDGEALYTVMCRKDGGIVDDCIFYRRGGERYFVVVNAANIAKDWAHVQAVAADECGLRDESAATALIAVQGPRAVALVASLCDRPVSDLPSFAFCDARVAGVACTVARTGYTGEDGFEIFCAAADAPRLWNGLLDAGRSAAKPCGLGARDTLRLEARLCLYGNDIDESTTPWEAGLGWVVKLDDHDFVGRDALVRQKAEGPRRRLAGFTMRERGIARHGMPIHAPAGAGMGARVGEVTSGTTSPTLGVAIGMGYVAGDLARPGSRLCIDVRGKAVAAEVVKGPFYKRAA